ncbi:MAG: flagellar filament capping protein FliD [Chitinispirillaceae bacterium]|nr:flagellar filament capping protein FliD [Chitinispirillaceae bacterium]
MGISINGPSGIDTQYIIDSLVALERNKVTTVEKQKKAYQLKIDAYAKLKTMLTDLRTKATGLSKLSSFDLFTTSSTDEKIATITAGTGSVDATYDVQVFQLAGNEKMISADGLISDQNASLQSLGIGIGTISIDGVEIEIDNDDTLQDLRQKINSATDEDGGRIGVSASVLKIAEGNYRLVLTSKESGSAGTAYSDVSGTTLQDLGVILTAAGDKGNTSQVLTSGGNVQSAWEALAEGENVQITGLDRAGNEISVSIVKKPGSTAEDLLAEVNNAFNGMAEASFDGSGLLMITDKVGGSSRLSISEMTIGAAAETMSVSTYGDEGAGVLSIGKNAYFSVENIFMSSSSNSATGFVGGVTFDFHSVSKGETVTVALERDHDAIHQKFQEMLDAYNALVRFSKSNTKVVDPNDENAKSGDLAGDMTVRSIISRLNNMFHQQFDELNTVYTSFNMIGLKTDITNGELKIDDEMFNKALTERFDEVVNLFITVGTSDNSNIVLGTSSSDTQAGIYLLEEVDGEHFQAQRTGDSTWYTSAARVGDIVSFEDGPLTGLSLTAPAGSIGVGNSATFTLSKGLSTVIDDAIDNLTRAQDGLVALRTESWQRSMSRADDKIMRLEERIEKYRLRLVNQFSAMEQALSTLQTQSANMLNAIGSFSYYDKS